MSESGVVPHGLGVGGIPSDANIASHAFFCPTFFPPVVQITNCVSAIRMVCKKNHLLVTKLQMLQRTIKVTLGVASLDSFSLVRLLFTTNQSDFKLYFSGFIIQLNGHYCQTRGVEFPL